MSGAKGIETQQRVVDEHYGKSTDGLDGGGTMKLNGDHVREINGEEAVNEEVVAQGLHALETKKKH